MLTWPVDQHMSTIAVQPACSAHIDHPIMHHAGSERAQPSAKGEIGQNGTDEVDAVVIRLCQQHPESHRLWDQILPREAIASDDNRRGS